MNYLKSNKDDKKTRAEENRKALLKQAELRQQKANQTYLERQREAQARFDEELNHKRELQRLAMRKSQRKQKPYQRHQLIGCNNFHYKCYNDSTFDQRYVWHTERV